jgi:TolA-binding protein
MKRILLVTLMLLFAGIILFAQQAGGTSLPTTAQTKQNAQQLLTQARSNSSQFESVLTSLKAQNTSNNDADTYRRLKVQIDQLEARINKEQSQMQARLDQGFKVSNSIVDQIQRLIEQHKAAMAEMEAFISSR